ncbi:MAG TPA: hypothetical protein VH137_05475 [Gemmatimonadales bacterium]|nr:hypothetical protein [Gemmatimonadales bacterium]
MSSRCGPADPWREAAWAARLLVSACSLAWFERRMARRGRPLATVRWVAVGLAILALGQLALRAARAARAA